MAAKCTNPGLAIQSTRLLDEIRTGKHKWYHNINVADFETPGLNSYDIWDWLLRFLEQHKYAFAGKEIFEHGPADGLWTMWMTRFGARRIIAADHRDYATFRMIAETFGLPVDYFPGLISSRTPKKIARRFDTVCSLGVLYHVHDPLVTLVMYHEYARPGGYVIIETACVQEDLPLLYYSPQGLVIASGGNNHFCPTTGFMTMALKEELNMDIIAHSFLERRHAPIIDRPFGRAVFLCKKVSKPTMSNYQQVIRQLNMEGFA